MMLIVRILAFALGAAAVAATLRSAVQTFVLPRGMPDLIVRAVFQVTRGLLTLGLGRRATYADRDRVLAPSSRMQG